VVGGGGLWGGCAVDQLGLQLCLRGPTASPGAAGRCPVTRAYGRPEAGATITVTVFAQRATLEVIVRNWAYLTPGQRIKHLRGSDLTQQGLAEIAGVSVALVQKAEHDRGDLSVGSLLKLAAALKTDVSVLLGQQAPRRGMNRNDRAALRQLSDAVHESAL